ncbi:hypothetical protein RJ41_14310 [Alteromonas marina]|uniref:Sulfotransferase domain-containing protein n=1 Tax=Alteromonas marina TaxID=203795 RepID=A0A0B3Y1D7_9ALTE|nr:sulfotransferase [Alteromonas marina]KHT48276.1 hypothetical protein RJ41_14310 [Alteromonas marina]
MIEVKPIHICIGAPRSGTTWLFNNLASSTEIFLPCIKEVRYWWEPRSESEVSNTLNFHRGEGLNARQARWLESWKSLSFDKSGEDYLKLMGCQDMPSLDISPSYAIMPEETIKQVFNSIPKESKVFLFLRNPLDRLLSEVKLHAYMHGNFRGEAEAKTLIDFAKAPVQKKRSQYSEIVRRWSAVFGDRFKVFYYEDFAKDAESYLREICDFLGIYQNSSIPQEKLSSYFGSDKGTGKKSLFPKFSNEVKLELAELALPVAREFSAFNKNIAEKWETDISESTRSLKGKQGRVQERDYWPLFSKLLRMSESLGDNCEFGFFQRAHSYEPSSLFRWAITPIKALIKFIETPSSLYEKNSLRLKDSDLIFDEGTGFYFHSSLVTVREGERALVSEEEFTSIFEREKEKLDYLNYKFRHQLVQKPALFVIKANEGIAWTDILQLHMQLVNSNSGHKLLVVTKKNDPSERRLEKSDVAGIYIGRVDRFASYSQADDIDLDGWTQIFAALTKDSEIQKMLDAMFV